jgi:hypothetical protein
LHQSILSQMTAKHTLFESSWNTQLVEPDTIGKVHWEWLILSWTKGRMNTPKKLNYAFNIDSLYHWTVHLYSRLQTWCSVSPRIFRLFHPINHTFSFYWLPVQLNFELVSGLGHRIDLAIRTRLPLDWSSFSNPAILGSPSALCASAGPDQPNHLILVVPWLYPTCLDSSIWVVKCHEVFSIRPPRGASRQVISSS